MMDSVDYKIDFICDMLHSEHIPPGALQQIKRAADMNHPNMGLAIYVGMNPLMQALGTIFRRVYPASGSRYRFDFAPTLAEAERKLAQAQLENE